jgi:hypothetical protein
MAINRIVTEKELNYLETLCLYANLEEFITKDSHALDWLIGETNQKTNKLITIVDIENMYGEEKYKHMLGYIYDTLLINAKEYLGDGNGRSWYEFDNYKLGIMEYDKANKANQFNVEIQYFQHHMFRLDSNLKGLELPFDGTHDQYHFKRIDICKMFKSPIDYTTGHNYLSSYRNVNGHNRKENTVYLGNRRNGNVFRMYPKTIELKETENYKKMELLSSYFGDVEDLYTFELELHRSQLKGTLDIDTLDDLEKVYQAYKNIVGKIRIYKDTDHNKKLLKQGNRSRIKGLMITDYVEYDRILKKRYKPSKDYAMSRQEKTFNRYIETMGIKEEKEINKLRIEFGMNIASNGKQEVRIEFEDVTETVIEKVPFKIDGMTFYKDSNSVLELGQNEMKERYERLRDGNDQLQSEANNAFSPRVFNDPSKIF